MLLQCYGLDHVLVRKSSGQSFKSSCRAFHKAKCFHVYEPFCKVKQFTKTYSHFKNIRGAFSYEIVAFCQTLLVAFVIERFHNAVEIDILGIFFEYSSLQIWPPQKIFQGRNYSGRMT